ncbi:hypothetical protein ACQ4PT_003874 [Festuca glaucescens]
MNPIETVWEIIFLCSITFVPILLLLGSIIDGEIEIKRVTSKIDFVCAFAHIYGMIKEIAWGTVLTMLFTIASISVSVYAAVVKKRLNRRVGVGDLGVAIGKLHEMETALCRLNQIPFAEQRHIWLKRVGDLQRTAQDINVGYDRCGLNYSKRLYLSSRAQQELKTAKGLLRQGDSLMHPHDHLEGTMKFYEKKVINFIKNRSELLGIWGMGGVGKTSLLKLLVRYSRQEYTDHAFQVLFVRVGTGYTVGQVQEAIATSMRLSLNGDETSQAKIIHDHLKHTSFLLLLDDLWGYLDLDAVGIPLPLGTVLLSLRGIERRVRRKVVLTSRYMVLCRNMGCRDDNTIQMKSFTEEEAWELHSSGWPVAINTIDHVAEVLFETLLQQPRHLVDTQPPETVGDGHPQHPQDDDGSSEMMSSYEKMCYFIEARDAKSLLFGVWGKQGVGKTTLLGLARDSYRYKACFDHILFVGAGTGHMVKNVQHAIAINLGLDLAKMSSFDELSRAELIFNHLEHKSFLLLLDDIREPLNWWTIGLPLFLHRQQKIILATRSRAACALMGCHVENTIEMKCLGEVDAWKLFRDTAGQDDNPQINHFAHEMVARCGGLPLALSALGRAMSNKRDPREWRCAYNQISGMGVEPSEIDDKVCNIIFHNPLWKKTAFEPMFSSENLDDHDWSRQVPGYRVNAGGLPSLGSTPGLQHFPAARPLTFTRSSLCVPIPRLRRRGLLRTLAKMLEELVAV